MNYDETEAGPEMDAVMAEKVMGYCQEVHALSRRSIANDPDADAFIKNKCTYGVTAYVGDEDDLREDGERQWYCGCHDRKVYHWGLNPPPYSTDPTACMAALEKMNAKGWESIWVWNYPDGEFTEKHMVTLIDVEAKNVVQVRAPTFTLAACRAMLKVVT